MYGKIFGSIFDSTLVADGGWLPTYIFIGMCALADKDGIVDIAPRALYSRLGFPGVKPKPVSFTEFMNAIDYLQQPDLDSKSIILEGRRIVKMSDVTRENAETLHVTLHDVSLESNRGFLIVNYVSYREKASKTEKKGASTARVQKWRERQKSKTYENVTGECNANVTHETKKKGHIDIDIDIDNKNILSSKPDEILPKNKKNGQKTLVMHKQWATEVLDLLKTRTNKNIDVNNENHQRWLIDRFKEGATARQARAVVAVKCRQWLGDEKMEKHLVPKTLFNKSNYWSYVCELPQQEPNQEDLLSDA